MTKALCIIAILFTLVGAVGFAMSIDDIKDAKKTSEFWEESARDNYDNHLIAAEADKYLAAYTSQVIISVVTLVSGIVVGVFFLALAKIISVLESIRDKRVDMVNHLSNETSVSV